MPRKLEEPRHPGRGHRHDFKPYLCSWRSGNLDLDAPEGLAGLSCPREHRAVRTGRAPCHGPDAPDAGLFGQGRFIVRAMDLSELVEENAHLFRSGVARTATLDVRLGRPLPSIEARCRQVQQVIMNLITTPSDSIGDSSGRIILHDGVQECDSQCLKQSRIEDVPPAGRFVSLESVRHGVRNDEQTQQRLFDPFFTTRPRGRGLADVGESWASCAGTGAPSLSRAAGQGTSIRILFPASSAIIIRRDERWCLSAG